MGLPDLPRTTPAVLPSKGRYMWGDADRHLHAPGESEPERAQKIESAGLSSAASAPHREAVSAPWSPERGRGPGRETEGMAWGEGEREKERSFSCDHTSTGFISGPALHRERQTQTLALVEAAAKKREQPRQRITAAHTPQQPDHIAAHDARTAAASSAASADVAIAVCVCVCV